MQVFDDNVGLPKGPMVIMFGATWCAPCKAMKQIMTQATRQMPSIPVVYVDIDQHPTLTSLNGIRSVPIVNFYNKDGVVAEQLIGLQKVQTVVDGLDRLLE